ncbi:hypothetical protein GCM10028798_27710 [Humibacter antri]
MLLLDPGGGRDRGVASGPDVQRVEVLGGATIEGPQGQRRAADEPDASYLLGAAKFGDEITKARDDVISV